MSDYHKKYYLEHKEDYKRRAYNWVKKNPDKIIENRRNWRVRLRIKALKCLSNELKCVNCGCDEYKYLEINHKKLFSSKNGTFEKIRKDRGDGFMRAIISNSDAKKKYEITCKVCNSLHYLINKYPNIINKHKILWKQN